MVVNTGLTAEQVLQSQYQPRLEKALERLATGLRINDTADDPASSATAVTLNSKASSLYQGIENANSALATVDSSKQILSEQKKLLEEIATQLISAQAGDATDKKFIQNNIQDKLKDLNDLAKEEFDGINLLQESKSNSAKSLEHTFTLSDKTSVTTSSLQSNTTGLDLTLIESLSPDTLDNDTAYKAAEKVEDALKTIDSYTQSLETTKDELSISVNHFSGLHELSQKAKEDLTSADLTLEQGIKNAYDVLVSSSEFAVVQSNVTQERVLSLLSNVPEYEGPKDKSDTTKDTTNNNEPKKNFYQEYQKTSSNYNEGVSSGGFEPPES